MTDFAKMREISMMDWICRWLASCYLDEKIGELKDVNENTKKLIKDFQVAFKEVDLILGPTMPFVPWIFGKEITDPVANYMADILTAPQTPAGLPAGSVPCGKLENLPIGFQITGPRLSDFNILKAMDFVQQKVPMSFELDKRLKEVMK